ncbi:DUF169 domain-containing protein [Acidicapsa dinghuensis]|uniref:DUF169 domain-containing protein n=1 Tax=Acidicapsa dinghuensis TaxID=2218256 RepID=A0ABW1EBI7_9BACT|nr:DUF169 domain-containing protein [Acidicapsa dinghuensis]
MREYAALAEELNNLLQLRQPAIAISFSDSIPAGVSIYTGSAPAGCRFWQEAAQSSFATSSADHSLCAIGVHTHNLEPSPEQQTDLMDALKVFADLGYVRQEDIPQIPVLQSRARHVVYAPLATPSLQPDVVLLFVSPNQMLLLSEAVQQVEGHNAPALGRPACAVVPQVVNSGRAAVSMGCCGARAYLDNFTDDVAIFALPGATLAAYVERLRILASANTVLSRFHQLRRADVYAGSRPSIQTSLEHFAASQQ